MGKCVQLQNGEGNEKVTLEECKLDSALQEWQWNPETHSLRNPHTGKCLTALKIQDQGTVGSLSCRAEDDETQAWSCSKKGHLTLLGKGFHLSGRFDSSDVFLSAERGKSAKWRTLNERTVCEKPLNGPKKIEPIIIAKVRLWQRKSFLPGTIVLIYMGVFDFILCCHPTWLKDTIPSIYYIKSSPFNIFNI